MGRPRKKNRVILTTYNISIENSDRLDEIKLKGENQDAVITRLLYKYELSKDAENYRFLLEDTLGTVKDLRRKNYLLEQRQNNTYKNPLWMNRIGYLELPYII